jgi:hypothetical protein
MIGVNPDLNEQTMPTRPRFVEKAAIDRPIIDLHRGEYGRVTADAAAILERLVHPHVAANPTHAMWVHFLDSPWKRVLENLAQNTGTTTDQLDQTLATADSALTDDADRFAQLEHIVALALTHAEQINEGFVGPEHLIVGLFGFLAARHPGPTHDQLADRAPEALAKFLGKTAT